MQLILEVKHFRGNNKIYLKGNLHHNLDLTILVSIFGVAFFALQSLYYKLTGKSKQLKNAKAKGIVIFSEGKNYWGTWKGIVEKLIEKEQPFTYYTMDLYDPCLDVASPFMEYRYIGSGTFAYSKLNKLQARVLLSTTPNIGADGYPLKRSPYVQNMVHIYHALNNEGPYHRHALDAYDSVLLSGEFQIKSIRKLEELRGLKEKNLIPAGLPYIDEMAKKIKTNAFRHKVSDRKIILIAPSWGNKNSLALYGLDFVKKLAQKDFDIIIRPHPQTVKAEQKLLKEWQGELQGISNISWDFEVDGSESLARADVMISDVSTVRLDFAMLYQKPVVTLETPIAENGEYEWIDIGHDWDEVVVDEIGVFVPKERMGDIVTFVRDALAIGTRENLIAFRERNLYNFGTSAEVVANYLIAQVADEH